MTAIEQRSQPELPWDDDVQMGGPEDEEELPDVNSHADPGSIEDEERRAAGEQGNNSAHDDPPQPPSTPDTRRSPPLAPSVPSIPVIDEL